MRRLATLLLVCGGLVLVGAAASAYWSAPTGTGGQGVAQAATVNQGSAPSASQTAMNTVTVTWGGSTLSNGAAVTGYRVRRYNTSNVEQTVGGGCAGVVTATSCAESGVPAGDWKYTVTPVIGTHWQGAESAKSGTVTVGVATLTLSKTLLRTVPQTITGSLSGFGANEGITYRLDAGTSLTGSPSAASGTGTATITSLAIPATSDGSHTVYALGGNGSEASVAIVVDTTPPTVTGTLSPPPNGAGWINLSPVQLNLSGSDGAGSGISQIKYTLDGSDPTVSGIVYSGPVSIATTSTLKYYAADVAGNASAVTTRAVNIDASAPVNSLSVSNLTGNAHKAGDTVYYRPATSGSFTLTNAMGDTGGSGVASSGTTALSGDATGWSHTSSTVSTPSGGPYVSNAFSWSAGATGSPTVTVSGRDVAGNVADQLLMLVPDSAAPVGGSVDATGLVGTGSRYSTSTTLSVAFAGGSDPAGINASGGRLRRASATLTTGGCGAFGAFAQVGTTGLSSPYGETVADQSCYRYEYVVSDNVGNQVTYTSGDIKVDTTAPSAPTLSFSSLTNAHWSGSGTVYYRSNATSGSFTATASSSDARAGIAGYTFPSLGSGWSSSAGALGVMTYSWASAGPAAPSSPSVTATNNATLVSAGTGFTMTADTTGPSGGTITYTNGHVNKLQVDVSFTTGTDSGSGVKSSAGLLQRAAAPGSGGACGTFGGFATIATGPSSPYSDTAVTNSTCYKYQYVPSDNVGNAGTAVASANVVQVDYSQAVSNTASLVSYWRLGESTTTRDSFTDTSGTSLTSHTGETGAGWTHLAGTGTPVVTDAGRVRRTSNTYSIDYASGVPSSADYVVSADLYVASNLTDDKVGVAGRMNTTNHTFYMARYEQYDSSWNIARYNNGTISYVAFERGNTLTVGQTYRVSLEMVGSTLRLHVNGVEKLKATDTDYAAAGRAGIMDGDTSATSSKTNTTGYHLDNFAVQVRAADSKGSNTGSYLSGPTLGTAGALAVDPNTAATMNGSNTVVQSTTTTNFPTGASARSVELWFKTSSSSMQALYSYGTRSEAAMFGLMIENSTTLRFWGWGGLVDFPFTTSSSITDGAWHHLVHTYDGTTMRIYVDNTALTSRNVSINTAVDPSYGFGIGANLAKSDYNTGRYFAGSLDEVAIYNTALSATTVSEHYGLGAGGDLFGPTGGSVDATGLVGSDGRYATSTTLSVAFSAGTDPAGVNTAGGQLRRATATLTNGACGSYGAYTQVGSTGLSSPFGQTVTDQACYRYQYVVGDTVGNQTTYTSGDIKVDTTPASTPTLSFSSFSNTYWSGSGSTVYYRSNATSGSITVAATASDPKAGIAGYTYPNLGTGWAATAGALGVNTYSWSSASPAAPSSPSVTATNNAGLVSAGAGFTMTADITAPGVGTVSYANGTHTSGALNVSFTTGTDAGSGVGTRLLQRASATLSGSTCGSFGGFSTVATNPASPYQDSVSNGLCYKYQYVVADNVGNTTTATSGSIAKVDTAARFFQRSTDGLVVVEAENYNVVNNQGADGWSLDTTYAGFTGSGAMSTPDTAGFYGPGYATTSSRLDYEVYFARTGTHYVWVRGYELNGSADTVHVGLDYQENTTADAVVFNHASATWGWTDDNQDDATRLTVNVPTVGNHTLNLYVREAGAIVDRMLLTSSSSYTPSDNGPAETGGQLVDNSGFENSGAYPWTLNGATISTVAPVRAGSKKLLLGGADSVTHTAIQPIAVPTECTNANLSFYRRITSDEGASTAYDYLYVEVANSDNTSTLGTLVTLSNRHQGSSWVQSSTYDLAAYRGSTITLRFRVVNDGSAITSFHVDDAVLNCT